MSAAPTDVTGGAAARPTSSPPSRPDVELELYKLAVAAAGIVFAIAWWWLLQSYRKLNRAKFEVINEIERRLPLGLFTAEWGRLESAKAPRRLWPPSALRAWVRGYHELGTVERVVPVAFAAIYVAELIRQAAT